MSTIARRERIRTIGEGLLAVLWLLGYLSWVIVSAILAAILCVLAGASFLIASPVYILAGPNRVTRTIMYVPSALIKLADGYLHPAVIG